MVSVRSSSVAHRNGYRSAPIICMTGIDTAQTRLSRIDSVDTVIYGGIGSDFVLSDPP